MQIERVLLTFREGSSALAAANESMRSEWHTPKTWGPRVIKQSAFDAEKNCCRHTQSAGPIDPE